MWKSGASSLRPAEGHYSSRCLNPFARSFELNHAHQHHHRAGPRSIFSTRIFALSSPHEQCAFVCMCRQNLQHIVFSFQHEHFLFQNFHFISAHCFFHFSTLIVFHFISKFSAHCLFIILASQLPGVGEDTCSFAPDDDDDDDDN